MKSGFLLSLIVFASVFASTLSACSSDPSGQAIKTDVGGGGGGPKGQVKIEGKVPPLYNSRYWAAGSYWIWKEIKSPKLAKCIRWTIAEITAAGGVSMEQKITQDCKTYDGVKATHFHFFPSTGEVDSSNAPGIAVHSNIFSFLYGEDKIATYFHKPVTTLPWDGKFFVYTIDRGKSWYLHAEETMLQGTLIQNETLKLVKYHDSRTK